MRVRPILRLQACMLLALMGALASGAPTHHHQSSQAPVFANAEHHGHGTLLVELAERLTSSFVVAALPAAGTIYIGEPTATFPVALAPMELLVARGRPPPSGRPRAPPVSV